MNRVEVEGGTVRITNPKHVAKINAEGVVVQPTGADWSWQWHLDGIRKGNQRLLVEGAQPSHDGAMVRLARGSLYEQYILKSASMEQQFVIPESLPGDGDLVIRGHILTSAHFAELAEGWRWTQGTSQVLLGDVTVFDAEQRRLPARMEVQANRTKIVVDGEALDHAAYPVLVDPEIGANDFRISEMNVDGQLGFSGLNPSIAYNETDDEYLVVWQGSETTVGDEDVWGQRIDATTGAELGNDFQITFEGSPGTIDDGLAPVVAWNSTNNEYLVVYEGLVPSLDREIKGRFVSNTGSLLGAGPITLSDMGGGAVNPEAYTANRPGVAYNATNNLFLVVWRGDDNVNGLVDNEVEVFGQLVDGATRTETGSNDFQISNTGGANGDNNLDALCCSGAHTAVTWNSTDNQWLVVWSGESNVGGMINGEFEVFAQRLNGATGAELGSDLRLSDVGGSGETTRRATNPQVAYNSADNEFLVVFTADDGATDNENEVHGQRLSALGVELGSNDFQITSVGPDLDSSLAPNEPQLAYNPATNRYLLIWWGDDTDFPLMNNELEVWGLVLNADGSASGAVLRMSDAGGSNEATYDARRAALAHRSGSQDYLIAWDGDDDSVPGMVDEEVEIWGQRFTESVPMLEVTKTSTTTTVTMAGQIVPYSYTVTNTGSVALSNVTLVDDNTDAVPVCAPAQPASLTPGGSMNCTAQHTVTQGEIDTGGNLSNTATADSDQSPQDQASLDIPINQSPTLAVTKTSTTASVTAAGQIVPYSYTVSNTGNITLSNVALVDDNTDAVPVCAPAQPASLAPGGSMNCTAQHTVTQGEMDTGGNLSNTATADSDQSPQDQASLDIPINQSPTLAVTKTSTTASVTAAGQVVPYSYTVTNTGNITLSNVTLVDDNTDAVPICTPSQPNSLAPGDSLNCTAQHTVTQAEMDTGGNLSNTATADSDQSPQDQASLDIPINQSPTLAVTKTSTTASVTAAGQVVPYSYTVTNTGNITLSNVTLVDDNTDAVPICTPSQPNSLAPGDSLNCTAQHTVTQAEMDNGGNLSNTATADSDQSPQAQASLDIPINQSPTLAVTKTSTTTSVTAAGQVVPYGYTVSNTGNITLSNVTLVDDNTDAVPVCTPNQPASLAPGDAMNCTAQHTVTQAEMDNGGNLSNIATADSDQSSQAQASLDIPINQSPTLAVTKTSTTASVTAAGQVVPYSYTVSNTGNITLSNVTLVDDNTDAVPICTPNQPASLSPGDSLNCSAQHTVTQTEMDNGGNLSNTATADSDQSPQAQDSLSIPILQNASLSLEKDGSLDLGGNGEPNPGDLINYTFVLANTGNVTLSSISVTDPLVATITCPSGNPIPALAPAADETCSGSYNITQGDIDAGMRDNTAAAAGQDPGGGTVDIQDSHSTAIAQSADLALTKTVQPGQAMAGQDVVYTLVVTNLGPATATGTTVTDTLPTGLSWTSDTCGAGPPAGDTLIWPVGNLGPGVTESCELTLTLAASLSAGSLVNTAVASSDLTDPDPAAAAASAELEVTVPIVEIPTLTRGSLVSLALLIAVSGLLLHRRRLGR